MTGEKMQRVWRVLKWSSIITGIIAVGVTICFGMIVGLFALLDWAHAISPLLSISILFGIIFAVVAMIVASDTK
jgi:hypothetical protein